jgi:hypothetical protein
MKLSFLPEATPAHLHKIKGEHTLFEQVKMKFYSLWDNESISKEI